MLLEDVSWEGLARYLIKEMKIINRAIEQGENWNIPSRIKCMLADMQPVIKELSRQHSIDLIEKNNAFRPHLVQIDDSKEYIIVFKNQIDMNDRWDKLHQLFPNIKMAIDGSRVSIETKDDLIKQLKGLRK